MPMKSLFLQAPSFDGYDGGAGARYQMKREVKSFWFPTWLAQAAAMVPGSRLIDAPPAQFLKNYPEHHRFVEAKRELDPGNVFSNQLSDAICFAATADTPVPPQKEPARQNAECPTAG